MPLYEYKCGKCGDVFEVIQKFSDAPLKIHHECGGAVERLVSASALQFKGTGWYVTDYGKRGTSPPSNGGEKKTESKTDSSKSESKPASSAPASDKK